MLCLRPLPTCWPSLSLLPPRCGNVAAIMEVDEHLSKNYKVCRRGAAQRACGRGEAASLAAQGLLAGQPGVGPAAGCGPAHRRRLGMELAAAMHAASLAIPPATILRALNIACLCHVPPGVRGGSAGDARRAVQARGA